MSSEQICILWFMIGNFMWLQMNVVIIGNREYSMHYKSHLLVKKKGLAKLIYFKPQHFHRYSIWEVIAFFLSYIQLIVLIILFALGFVYESIGEIGLIIAITLFFSFLLGTVIKIIYIDFSNWKEEKNMNLLLDIKSSKDHYPYALTIRFQLESLYNQKLDSQKQSNDLLDEEFINYFRNYKLVEVEDDQVIYLRDKFLKYKIEFIFDSKKRMIFPKLEEGIYRPHFVIKGTKQYLGIEFESSDIEAFDQWGTGVVRTLYDLSLYDDLLPRTEFTIREGKKIVGSGKIIEMVH